MNPELEQPITDVINKLLKPKLGIDNVVEVIGLDASVKLAHALKDVPVQTTEKVVYIPKYTPPDSPSWYRYDPPPIWCGDRTAPLIGDQPICMTGAAGVASTGTQTLSAGDRIPTCQASIPVSRGDPE